MKKILTLKMPKLLFSPIFINTVKDNQEDQDTRSSSIAFSTNEGDLILKQTPSLSSYINIKALDERLEELDKVGNIDIESMSKLEDGRYYLYMIEVIDIIQKIENNEEANSYLIDHIRNYYSHVKSYEPGTTYSYFLGCTNNLNNMFADVNCSPYCASSIKKDQSKCGYNVFIYINKFYLLNKVKDSDQADIYIPNHVKEISQEGIEQLQNGGIKKIFPYTQVNNKFVKLTNQDIIDSFTRNDIEVLDKVFDGNRDNIQANSSSDTNNNIYIAIAVIVAVLVGIIVLCLLVYFAYYYEDIKSNIVEKYDKLKDKTRQKSGMNEY